MTDPESPSEPGPRAVPGPMLDYGSPRGAALAGAREAFGTPAVVLGASFIGFGALVSQVGLTIWHALFSTATGWALPGQVALIELYALGASVFVISAAVALTNARLLPMAVTLVPLLRAPGTARWKYYLASHLIAVTAWAVAMRHCPRLPVSQRLPYFAGLGSVLWLVTLVTTAIGFVLAGAVPFVVTLALVFINPIYFMLIVANDVRTAGRIAAALLGALCGPLLYLVTPDWSLLITGLVAGSLAYAIGRWRRRRA